METKSLGSSSYRDILQRELTNRMNLNPKYTLRAFARDLGVSPSQLSEILNGKHGVSTSKAAQFAKILGLNPKDAQLFRDSVESRHGRSQVRREAAKIRLLHDQLGPQYHQITLDQFAIIADWYHFGILKLLEVDGAKSDLGWISSMLGLEVEVTSAAIDRLVRVGLLKKIDEKWVASEAFVSTPTDIPSTAIKRFHYQILDGAMKSLYRDPVETRDFFVTLMPVDVSQLSEIKLAIKEFHDRVNRLTEKGASKKSVYCLGSQFFPLTITKEGS